MGDNVRPPLPIEIQETFEKTYLELPLIVIPESILTLHLFSGT